MIADYSVYHFSKSEFLKYISLGTLTCLVTGYLFYSNIFLSILLIPYIFIFLKSKKKNLIEKRKWQLNLEFRDGLLSLSSALNVGYSLENAFTQAVMDLKLMYSKESLIVEEFESIVLRISMNQTVESIMEDFGNRSGIEDITNFADVLKTAKRTGGDLIHVIRTTSKIINDKLEVKREIITLITAKKLEAEIMNMVPFGIILYLRLFSAGLLEPLYHNAFGNLFMTILLVSIYGVTRLSNKIMDIHI